MPEILSKTLDLCHYEGEGRAPESWYFQRYPDEKVSQDFPTRAVALETLEDDELEWED